MRENKISIITPSYNSEKYIEETIMSVLSQTYVNWEWLIVDDGSTDNSVEIINKYKDDRIKLFKSNGNQGAANARNIAISEATGRFITFIDSDDLWDSNFLEKSVNYLINNNESLVYSSYRRVDENLNKILENFIAEDNIDFKRILKNCPIPMLTAIYDIENIGKIMIPINKYTSTREDYTMWLDVLNKIPFARAIKEPLATYRIRKNSSSRNKYIMAYGQFMVYFKFLRLPFYKSVYYTLLWAYNGLNKYGKI